MVFIEGKLKSWDRAEMVIRILDEDLKEDDGNQTWTLEDIIDAVRNCVGDHRSTLVYLNQECQLCFCLYPMSKVIFNSVYWRLCVWFIEFNALMQRTNRPLIKMYR
ncbi:hypothetical protein DPMN_170666 [Dreissena polymorpha]|uniref:E3 ubiquitin-protein ligase RNF31 third UBA domain-containing protein n=1 Tax=Dreissena polymorpha TaxID=45954 RepID=A0A9D4IDE1_DREPO|nr:hypothetical protein DPMN_170666 [Dreissena polymorpha]